MQGEINKFDKFLGALYGVALGDALGAPFEFRNAKPKLEYNGILQDCDVSIPRRFHTQVVKASSITDDTEMTLQLLKSILKNQKYDVDNVILHYLKWANMSERGPTGMKNTSLGVNTRFLMKGVTTVRGFRKRQSKITEVSQSNGSLMRCLPIVLLSNWAEISDVDVSLTNDSKVNKECSYLYLCIIRSIIFGEELNLQCENQEVKNAVYNAINDVIVDVSESKGWVVHALYVALITFFNSSSFEEGMDFIAKHFIKGDTDTSEGGLSKEMAIAGGLLGSFYGYSSMEREKKTSMNIKKLNNYFRQESERPKITKKIISDLKKFIESDE